MKEQLFNKSINGSVLLKSYRVYFMIKFDSNHRNLAIQNINERI